MATKKLTMRAIAFDFLERAGWSAGQMFFATLLAGGTEISAGNLPWKYSGTLAIGAAVASVILTALQYLTKMTELTFWPDIVVRLAKTFLVAGGIDRRCRRLQRRHVRLGHRTQSGVAHHPGLAGEGPAGPPTGQAR